MFSIKKKSVKLWLKVFHGPNNGSCNGECNRVYWNAEFTQDGIN